MKMWMQFNVMPMTRFRRRTRRRRGGGGGGGGGGAIFE